MSWLRAYVRFWDRREGAEALALVRIAVGLVILLDLLQVARFDLPTALWAPIEEGGIGPSTQAEPATAFYAWFGASAASASALFGLTALCAVGLSLGLCTQLSALGLLLCSAQLDNLSPDASRGIDTLLRNVLAVLALSGAGAIWSIDARVRRGSFYPDAQVHAWPRYLLIVQLVLLYFWAGMLKQGPEWTSQDGYSGLFRVLNAPHYARFPLSHDQLVLFYPLLQVATFTTLLFERTVLLVPLMLWWHAHPERSGWLGRFVRRYRLLELWVGTGVIFHLSLAVLAKLGIFPWGCLALYPALASPAALRAALDRMAPIESVRSHPSHQTHDKCA